MEGRTAGGKGRPSDAAHRTGGGRASPYDEIFKGWILGCLLGVEGLSMLGVVFVISTPVILNGG